MSEAQYQLLRERLERLYRELLIIEQQLHPAITRLRTVLGEFLGAEPAQPAPAPPAPVPPREEAPRILVAEEPVAPAAEPRPPERELLFRLLSEISRGVRLRPYRVHKFTVAPPPITFEGNSYDLGDEYETVIMVPTIDAQIEVDKPVEVGTPVVKAYTALNLDGVRAKVVYYKGVTPGLVGEMNIWAFKY